MRKRLATIILSLCMALVIAATMAMPASADDPTPTPTATQTPSPTPTSTPLPKMHVTVATHVDSGVGSTGTVVCTTIEGGYYVLSVNENASFDTTDFTCLGEIITTESSAYDYSHCPTEPWKAQTYIHITVTYSGTIYYDADLQTSGSWVYWDHNPVDAPGDVGTGEKSGTVIHRSYAYECGPFWSTETLSNYVYVHDTAKEPCDQEYEDEETIAQGIIQATDEDGEDETLESGEEYRLKVFGGPWTDPLVSRRDTAVRFGSGDDWTPLSDFINGDDSNCTQGDPLDPTILSVVFTAPGTYFAIRVNDLDGQFADNTGNMHYTLQHVKPAGGLGTCEKQFARGALITSGVIPANWPQGVHPATGADPTVWKAGKWIEIVTKDGPWHNGEIPDNLYDVAIKNPQTGAWELLQDATFHVCSDIGEMYVHTYYQLPNSNGIDLRVWDDEDAAFANNTGSMGYEIYTASRNWDPGDCAAQFDIGDLIKTVNVPGNAELGLPVGTLYYGRDVTGGEEVFDTDYIAIETQYLWMNGAIPDASGGIAVGPDPGTDDFDDLTVSTLVECSAPTDAVGHVIVFIPYDANADNYWVRDEDEGGNWSDNSEYMQFKFYRATLLRPPEYTPGDMPGPGICDALYTKGDPGATYTLFGVMDDYVTLPTLTSGQIYGLEISAGPWLNNAVESYEVEINDGVVGGGTHEFNMVAWPEAACAQSADGLHLLLFFKALAGRQYKLRVYDPGAVFTDNDDEINVILYDNVNVPVIPPPKCSENYGLTDIGVTDPYIPGAPGGVEIPSISIGSGNKYALEITEEDYYYYVGAPSEHRFDADISTDNGANWETFNSDWSAGECVIRLNTSSNDYELRYRIYFTAPASGKIKMRRSYAGGLDPLLTLGKLSYRLYGATYTPPGEPPDDDDPIYPPKFRAVCIENYRRPSSLVKWSSLSLGSITFGSLGTVYFGSIPLPLPAVDDWIAYLQWTVRNFFAWCPQHTAVLLSIPIMMEDYEPFGTMTELNTAIDNLNTKIESMQSTGGEGESYVPYSFIFDSGGGETGSDTWQGLFPSPGENSPWAWDGYSTPEPYVSTPIEFDPYGEMVSGAEAVGGETDYVNYCKAIFEAHFGVAVGGAMCVLTNYARMVPLFWIVFQVFFDMGALAGLVKYFISNWIDPRMSA